jgi:hypothetical protein
MLPNDTAPYRRVRKPVKRRLEIAQANRLHRRVTRSPSSTEADRVSDVADLAGKTVSGVRAA